MAIVLGMNAKLYRNVGTFASPVWVEWGNVRDVTIPLEAAEADVTTRANNGWRTTAATLRDARLEFEIIWDPADLNFEAVQLAYLNNTSLDLAAMDGDISVTGNQGLRARFAVLNFTRTEPLEDAVKASVVLRPTQDDNPPEWFVVP